MFDISDSAPVVAGEPPPLQSTANSQETWTSCSAIAERPCDCSVGFSFGQKWKRIFCRHYRSIFNHCDVIGLQRYRIRWKITQNSSYYAVQDHSRSPMSVSIESHATSNQWLIGLLTDILTRTVSKLPYRRLLLKFRTKTATLRSWASFRGLWTTYTIDLRLTGKLVMDVSRYQTKPAWQFLQAGCAVNSGKWCK